MTGTACLFNWFLLKKRAKREISDQFSKSQYYRRTIFTKRNGILCWVQCLFLTDVRSKKEQYVRFQADFQGKPLIIERQFFQNVTVFMIGMYILFFRCFGQKKNKR